MESNNIQNIISNIDIKLEYLNSADLNINDYHNMADNILYDYNETKYYRKIKKILKLKYNIHESTYDTFVGIKQSIIDKFLKFFRHNSLYYLSDDLRTQSYTIYDTIYRNYDYILTNIFNNIIDNYAKTNKELIFIGIKQITDIMIRMFDNYHTNRHFYKLWLNKKEDGKYLDLTKLNIYGKKMTY